MSSIYTTEYKSSGKAVDSQIHQLRVVRFSDSKVDSIFSFYICY